MEKEAINSTATKRKGRGFKAENKTELQTLNFESLEDSQGKAQRSVEGWIIIVTNLHEELTEEDLIDLFTEFGPLKNIHLNLDRRTGYVKGYALLEYLEHAEAKEAVKAMDGYTLQGKKLHCDFAFIRGPK